MKKLFKKRERRRFLRVGTYHLLKYLHYKTQISSHPILSVSRNISGGGLMLITKEKLQPGDKVEIELNFPPFGETIRAIAQVVYITKIKGKNKWQAGARFIELGEPTLDRILDYIKYIKKSPHYSEKKV